MTKAQLLSCLTARPCYVCKYHVKNKCTTLPCVFDEVITEPAILCRYTELMPYLDETFFNMELAEIEIKAKYRGMQEKNEYKQTEE